MDSVKSVAFYVAAVGGIFSLRSTLLKGSESPLALYLLGLVASYFCTYVLPLRYNPSNPFTAEFARRRLKRYKALGGKDGTNKVQSRDLADMYGMEHVYLNLELQPHTMWENVGYWKNADNSFTNACRDLFDELLKVSGALDHGPAAILEVGCGCSETAMHMLRTRPDALAHYIGLNINRAQASFCGERLKAWEDSHGKQPARILRAFHADAALPSTWTPELTAVVDDAMLPHAGSASAAAAPRKWLLALDNLYHFEAGRETLLTHAREKFGASLVCTDYLIPEKLSTAERWLLWFTLKEIQVPWKNRKTHAEYVEMLVRCGYERESIQILDITEHVWAPYAKWLRDREDRWDEIGGSMAFARPFRHWGWVMQYWAWAGTLRQVIVVAHPRKK